MERNQSIESGVACYIFEQIASILDFIHSKGYCHLDIKLENFLIDQEGNVTFIDFGLSLALRGPDNNGKIFQSFGTKSYSCSEILMGIPYSGACADVYALGILLFALVAKRFPYDKADTSDKKYNLFINETPEKYWQSLPKPTLCRFKPNCIKLINGMISYNPLSRLTLPEILAHDWVKTTIKPENPKQALINLAHNNPTT